MEGGGLAIISTVLEAKLPSLNNSKMYTVHAVNIYLKLETVLVGAVLRKAHIIVVYQRGEGLPFSLARPPHRTIRASSV